MNATTSAYRFTRHADEYAVTRRHDGTQLGSVRRVGATWLATPATAEQGAHLYVTEHWTRHNAAIALDAAALIADNEAPVEQDTPDELAPGMYRVRVTVTNRDGVHTATEDMNPAAIDLARARPGWSVEILGESRVTIVEDEQDTPAASDAPAGRVRLIGVGNVPAVPLSDVRPGDRIAWNYGQTYTVVRNTKVAANTYELVERGDDGREWTRRKRGTKLVARRPGIDQAPAERPVRVIRPAHTIEQGDRIVLDGDTVTVLDVRRDDTARTVTLTTSYGAPRTVMAYAAVPVVFGAPDEEDAAPAATEPLAVGETFTRMVRGVGRRAKPRPVTYTVTGYAEGRHGPIVLVRSDYQGDGSMSVAALREELAGEEERRTAATRPAVDPRTVTGTPENIDARASARARGERAAQASLTFDESDRQAMTAAQLRATAGDALALF